jgi:hypothetical protein
VVERLVFETVLRQAALFEERQDLGQLVPARGTEGDVRHGLSSVISSRLMRARISSRTVSVHLEALFVAALDP